MLFVCTANINRSPMAAALMGRRLADVGRRADVSSAGLLQAGHPASPHAVATLAARGIDLSAHRTRRLSADLVAGADLVLGMERRHVRAAAVLTPGALDKTFTLKELVRRALVSGQRRPGEPFVSWLSRLTDGRDTADLVRDDERDAVRDPVGCPPEDYERCADELDLLVRGVRFFIWDGAGTAQPAPPTGTGSPQLTRPTVPGTPPPPAGDDPAEPMH